MIAKTLKTIRTNAIYLLSAESIIRLLMLVFTVFISRFYTNEQFGAYTLALSIGSLFEVLTSFGIGTLFLQQNIENKDQKNINDSFSKFITLKLILSILLTILTIGFSLLLNKNPETLTTLIIAGVYIGLYSFTSFLWVCFDLKQQMQYTAAMKIVFHLSLFSLGIYFILNQFPIYWLIGAYLFGTVITLITSIATLYISNFSKLHFKIDTALWKKILIEGWPITISGTFVFVYNYLDTIIISITRGEAMVGLYQVSYKIIGTIFILAGLINQSYMPAFMASKKDKTGTLSNIFNSNIRTILFWSIPITTGGIILAPNIIQTIFGPQYMGSVGTFKILIWNCLIFFLSTSISTLIYAIGKQRNIVKAFMFGAIINTLLNIFIIPLYGIEGAALTTVLAELVVLTTMYAEAKKLLNIKINLIGNSRIPVAASLIMAAGILLIQPLANNLYILVPLGGIIYFGISFLFQKFTIKPI